MYTEFRTHIRSAIEDLRFQGTEVFAWKLLLKMLSPVAAMSHQILFDYDLTTPIAPCPARVDCEIGPATEAEIEEIVAARFPAFSPADFAGLPDDREYLIAYTERELARFEETFRRRCIQWMRTGEQCFIARVGGRIVHSNWIRFDWCKPAPERPILLRPGEIYMTEAHTVDDMRGKAIHGAVNAAMLIHAQQLGCKRAYTITDLTKAASRRGVVQVGWKYRGNHLFASLRGLDRTWIIRLGGDVEPLLRELLPDEEGTRTQAR